MLRAGTARAMRAEVTMDNHGTQHAGRPALAGVVGFFDEPGLLIDATQKLRDSGRYAYFDTFTPYPVHGLEKAQGLKRSPLPWVTFFAGLTGCTIGFGFQYWTSAVDWPIIIGGKPFNSWPAFIPVTFELTVLLAALSTVAAMFAINGLPNMFKKAFDPAITNNRFALVIEPPPPVENDMGESVPAEFNEQAAQDFLKQLGAKDVRAVKAEGWFG